MLGKHLSQTSIEYFVERCMGNLQLSPISELWLSLSLFIGDPQLIKKAVNSLF